MYEGQYLVLDFHYISQLTSDNLHRIIQTYHFAPVFLRFNF